MTNSDTQTRTLSFARALLIVFGPFAGGYFFSYLYRSVNAVVAPALRSELHIDAAELGLLSATYFMAFALCQIPLGVLLDRYGPRRARIFFTSLGHKSDFDKPQFRRLLDNAMSWATDRKRENRERKQRRERP